MCIYVHPTYHHQSAILLLKFYTIYQYCESSWKTFQWINESCEKCIIFLNYNNSRSCGGVVREKFSGKFSNKPLMVCTMHFRPSNVFRGRITQTCSMKNPYVHKQKVFEKLCSNTLPECTWVLQHCENQFSTRSPERGRDSTQVAIQLWLSRYCALHLWTLPWALPWV